MNRRISYLLIASLFMFLFSCAELQEQVMLEEGNKENIVDMKAHNHKFQPNNMLTYEGNTILFRIRNVTVSDHNFTLTDPAGTELENIDIPRDEVVEIKITFSRPGIYHFYCNKPLHSTLGMKGQIEVVRR